MAGAGVGQGYAMPHAGASMPLPFQKAFKYLFTGAGNCRSGQERGYGLKGAFLAPRHDFGLYPGCGDQSFWKHGGCLAGRFMMAGGPAPVLHLLLMLDDLPIQLVYQPIYGRIHVVMGHIGKDIRPIDLYCGFGLLALFFHSEYDMNVDYVVKVAFKSFELGADVIAHGVSDIDMMTGNIDLHGLLLGFCLMCSDASS
jgi:hypothetical protein